MWSHDDEHVERHGDDYVVDQCWLVDWLCDWLVDWLIDGQNFFCTRECVACHDVTDHLMIQVGAMRTLDFETVIINLLIDGLSHLFAKPLYLYIALQPFSYPSAVPNI